MGATTNLWCPPTPILWSAQDAGGSELSRLARQFLAAAEDGPWSIAWCAGAGVVSSTEQALQMEIAALRTLLAVLSTAQSKSKGSFFLASSAGGVYAGVGAPPYDELSPVRPISAYGSAKLEAEAMVSDWSQENRIPVFIGRIANLYGSGQNLAKAQGIISQMCWNRLTGRSSLIYVSLDTIRDYLFAPDCARLIVDGLLHLREECRDTHPKVVVKILASQRSITIGALLGEMRRVFKGSMRFTTGATAASTLQVRDLTMRSRVWPDIDRRPLTPLPVGIGVTAADLLRRLQNGESLEIRR